MISGVSICEGINSDYLHKTGHIIMAHGQVGARPFVQVLQLAVAAPPVPVNSSSSYRHDKPRSIRWICNSFTRPTRHCLHPCVRTGNSSKNFSRRKHRSYRAVSATDFDPTQNDVCEREPRFHCNSKSK